ncbi:MAG: hypothetical protein HOE90_01775 [Bacteriovoracaceae bacterium]|jgi:hypothetical protein|nr:hypothetical protein [Bacteriovoracaceae bacterium]
MGKKFEEKIIQLDLDISELTPHQVRLIKSLNTMITHMLTADAESEFFNASGNFMQICASLIKLSHFAGDKNAIPYGQQAIEFSIDKLNELLENSDVVNWDC